jgi:hypothetical protein
MFIVLTVNAELPHSYFYAFGENNEIEIHWDYTGNSLGLLGCNLFRSEDYGSEYSQMNNELIVSNDNTFIYLDDESIIDTTIYYYKINYVFSDSSFNQYSITGSMKEVSFSIYSEDTVQITCIPRQTGSYEFQLYRDGCVMFFDFFEDSLEIYQQPEFQINYEYYYEFIKIPEFTFSFFRLTESFLYSLLNPAGTQDYEITVYSTNLYQNHPNPFNPSTTIEFSIQKDSKIDLSIYNIKGQKIRTLAQNDFTNGSHTIIWDGDNNFGKPVSSGIYYYKLNVNGKTEAVKKCMLLK